MVTFSGSQSTNLFLLLLLVLAASCSLCKDLIVSFVQISKAYFITCLLNSPFHSLYVLPAQSSFLCLHWLVYFIHTTEERYLLHWWLYMRSRQGLQDIQQPLSIVSLKERTGLV
jgi:hypothetical protein